MNTPWNEVRPEDRFSRLVEPALVNGHPALVRALLLQRESDRPVQLHTARHFLTRRLDHVGQEPPFTTDCSAVAGRRPPARAAKAAR